MAWEEELEAIARDLRKAASCFKGGWHPSALQAFIRDGGFCVYCRKPLLETYGVSKTATIDHLFPVTPILSGDGTLIIWFRPVPRATA